MAEENREGSSFPTESVIDNHHLSRLEKMTCERAQNRKAVAEVTFIGQVRK